MRRRLSQITALLVLVALVGCGASPAKQWKQAALVFQGTEKSLNLAHDSGLVQDEDLVALQPYLQMGKGALDEAFNQMVADLAAGTTPQGGEVFERFLDVVEEAIARVLPYLITRGGE